MKDDAEQSTTSTGPIRMGTQIEVELTSRDDEIERLIFTIVPDEQADFAAGFLGAGTPLAKTILGQTVGSELPYPVADMRSVKIVAAGVRGRRPTEDIPTRRETVTQDAVSQSEFTNAVIFASAVNTKWGDYDVDGLDPKKWASKT